MIFCTEKDQITLKKIRDRGFDHLYLRFGKRDYDDGGDEDDDFAKRRQLWKRFSRLQRANDFLRDRGSIP